MSEIKAFIFSPSTLLYILLAVEIWVVVSKLFNVKLRSPINSLIETSTVSLIERSEEKRRRRVQLEQIGKKPPKFLARYRYLVSTISESVELGMSIEIFNLLLLTATILITFLVWFFLESLPMAILAAFPIACAIFVTFLKVTKVKVRAKENAIMDTLDLVCPMIGKGVVYAIKENLMKISPRIRHHFTQFLFDIEQLNITFEKAMNTLEEKLGPKFYSFANKARIYEYNEKSGMIILFEDITNMNKVYRNANYLQDKSFERINTAMIGAIGIILLFLIYMYGNSFTGDFMRNQFLGKLATSVSVSTILIIYTLNQLLQIDIDFSKVERDYFKKMKV